MGRLRRPALAPGPLKTLNDTIHELHLHAGLPSLRELRRQIGPEVASHSRIYDVFSSERLPSWGLTELIVEALSARAPGLSAVTEQRRFHELWVAASRHGQGTPSPLQSAAASVGANSNPVPSPPQEDARTRRQAVQSVVGRCLGELSDTMLQMDWVFDHSGRMLLVRQLQDMFPEDRIDLPDQVSPKLWTLAVLDQIRYVDRGLEGLLQVVELLEGESTAALRFREIATQALNDVHR